MEPIKFKPISDSILSSLKNTSEIGGAEYFKNDTAYHILQDKFNNLIFNTARNSRTKIINLSLHPGGGHYYNNPSYEFNKIKDFYNEKYEYIYMAYFQYYMKGSQYPSGRYKSGYTTSSDEYLIFSEYRLSGSPLIKSYFTQLKPFKENDKWYLKYKGWKIQLTK